MDTNSVLINGKSLLELIPCRLGGRFTWVNTTSFTIGTASEDTIFSDDTGALLMSFNGTRSCNISSVGPAGLQTGSTEAADTWYGVYIIGDTTLANIPKILLIPDGTAFSESGYDVKKLVAWVRNDGSSDIVHTKQVGNGIDRKHYILESQADRKVLNAGSATSPTLVDCSDFIPPGVTAGFFAIQFETGTAGAASDQVDINDPDSTASTLLRCQTGFVGGEKTSFDIECSLNSSQQIEYDVDQGGANENRCTIIVTGYILNL